jgi:hypothetical protein
MKTVLIVGITLIPVILTGTALRHASIAAENYKNAERSLISALIRFNRYERLVEVRGLVQQFLESANPDVRQLAVAITTVTDTAARMEIHDYANIIIEILHRNSDLNKARFLSMLLEKVNPPQSGGERDFPTPRPSPSSSSRAAESAPVQRARVN